MPHHNQEKSTFQPVHPFNLEDPKSWAQTAGTMDWDTTHICFTKRSLLDFLKQVGVSVGTNYTEISKLPKYATFGKFSQAATNEAVKDLVEAEIADPSNNTPNQPHTTRKVTQPPGGPSNITISGGEIEEQDALSMAPPRGSEAAAGSGDAQGEEVTYTHTEKVELRGVSVGNDGEERPPGAVPGFRPTRKVREAPGGKSSMGDLLFGGYEGN